MNFWVEFWMDKNKTKKWAVRHGGPHALNPELNIRKGSSKVHRDPGTQPSPALARSPSVWPPARRPQRSPGEVALSPKGIASCSEPGTGVGPTLGDPDL